VISLKKRAMKKWIPKGMYCHSNGGCKWWKYIKTIKLHRDINCEHKNTCKEECWTTPKNSCQVKVCRCEYMGYTDWNEESLLWDKVKECGIKDC
jgi:hypothetical protein